LIRSFGEEDAILIGHDWGGAIAWYTATFYPGQIKRLVILNCPHPSLFYRGIRKPAQLRRSWYMFFFQLPWVPEWVLSRKDYQFVKRALRGSAVQKDAFDHETLRHYRDAIARPQALSKAVEYYRVMFRDLIARRRFPWDQLVTVPTLVIWGEQDVALGKELNDGLSEWVKDLQVCYITDSGHWVQQEKYEEVNRILIDFLGVSSSTRNLPKPKPARDKGRRTGKKASRNKITSY
jgi:pimeloyl-ACP methyl ester carboxylesterase